MKPQNLVGHPPKAIPDTEQKKQMGASQYEIFYTSGRKYTVKDQRGSSSYLLEQKMRRSDECFSHTHILHDQ